jgi:hypothetical protein
VAVADYYRVWGNQFIYDRPTLARLFELAGFVEVIETPLLRSEHPELRDLEFKQRMPSGLLALSTMSFEAARTGKLRLVGLPLANSR